MKKKKNIWIYLQLFLTLLVIILFILLLCKVKVVTYLRFVLALDLFVIAYNNQKIYKRKVFTVIYVLAGLFILIAAFLGL